MTSIAPAALISRLGSMINDCLGRYVEFDQPLAIVDFPDIRNCGDSAIWLGEMAWLKRYFGKEPSYVCRLHDFSESELRKAVPEGPIFIHGGGSFGDIWHGIQDFRERIIEAFPDRTIIQFPQSIHYNSPERLAQSARVVGRHKNFKLMVRDRVSREIAEKHFDCEIMLCPDMAFAIGPLPPRPSSFPILAMLREDLEKADIGKWTFPDIPREDWITENPYKVKLAKLGGAIRAGFTSGAVRKYRFLDAAANQRFERGISQIARGEVIVTDRLHVHICSTLLGRPHVVLDNSYGKIGRLMDTFYPEGTGITSRATDVEEAVSWAREQLSQVESAAA